MKTVDLLVRTNNPESLDRTVQSFGAAVVGGGEAGGYVLRDGCYLVRCFSDLNFIEFAIKNQGYGTVVGRQDV